MGRVRTKEIKRLALKLIEEHPDKFSTSFEKNKLALKELGFKEKRFRNRLAGYIVRVLKKR